MLELFYLMAFLQLFAFMGFLAVVSLLVEFMQKSTNDDFIEALSIMTSIM